MEHRVDIVLLHASQHISRLRELSVEKGEIRMGLQHARVVQRAGIVELVEAHHVVRIRVLDHQVPNQPGGAIPPNQHELRCFWDLS